MAKNPSKKKSHAALFFLALGLFFPLLMNIYYSQQISPLYFKLANDDQKSIVEFLKKIKLLPEFEKRLTEYANTYGKTIENEVFQKDRQRRIEIKNLEQLLGKNQKARDVLYSLYLLHKEDGNNTKAESYLKQAQEIDPAIKQINTDFN